MNYDNLIFYNGFGGFDSRTGEYVIDGSKRTPLAWSNVVTSPTGYPFGFIITERGGGYVWKYNSRENRLTKWHGSCAFDVPNEWIGLTVNDGTKSIQQRLICENDEVRFGFGYSTFHKKIKEMDVTTKVTVYVAENDPVKLTLVEIIPNSADVCVTVKYHADICEDTDNFVSNAFDCENIRIKQGQIFRNVYMLGQETLDKQGNVIDKYSDVSFCVDCLEKVSENWKKLTGTIQVQSEDRELDCLMNGWLLYQTISCRLYARSSMYQSGGAYGYRDQLQDTIAVNYVAPDISRKRILDHCAHQYLNGNVQHWWHPAYRDIDEFGIQSKYSDDMLWLVFCTYKYVICTGDVSILHSQVSYIDSDGMTESLFEHCMRSIDYANELGSDGLPLMRGGDWNDGMNKIGNDGKGQSVWLGWFLRCCLDAICKLSELADAKNPDYVLKRKEWQQQATNLVDNINNNAWDGKWYIRAITDEGDKVGSRLSDECKIDSVSQSWSVLSFESTEHLQSVDDRSCVAIENAVKYLFDEDAGLVRLLWPPFSQESIDKIGYIAAYPPGLRENGAYTHAAVWLARSLMNIHGKESLGYKMLKAVNPINHTATRGECALYRVEPYVIAADIYSHGRNAGKGGWTWYTGSASWYFVTVLESLFGFVRKGSWIEINSKYHRQAVITYRYRSTVYKFRITPYGKGSFQLTDDGNMHEIAVK